MKIWAGNSAKLVMAIAIALLLVSQRLEAQNNKANIDDEVFAIYQQADKNRLTETGLQISEKAYDLALKKGDKKAQCMVLCPQIFYYYHKREDAKLKAVVDRIMEVSKRNKQSKYYNFAWSKWIEYNINERNLLVALQEALKMNKQMLEESSADPYDIATSYRTLANVYWGRYEYDLAAKYYMQALDYCKKNIPNQDVSVIYMMLWRYYTAKHNQKRALELLNEGIDRCNNRRVLAGLYSCKAYTYYELNDKQSFMSAYSMIKELEERYGEIATSYRSSAEVMKHILEGHMAKAKEVADGVKIEEDRLDCQIIVARAENNSKDIYGLTEKLIDLYTEDFSKVHSKDVVEINRSLGEIRFKADNMQLQLQLEKSLRAKDLLEKEKILARENMKDLKLANYNLKLNETKTIDSLNKSKLAFQTQTLAAQKAKVKQEEEAHKLHITIFVLLLTFLLTILFNEWLNKKKSQMLIAQLSQSNYELELAKEKAEESSRMKTMFVQNVSHEIRTPLNAIVGFADLLVNPDMELGSEEKAQFASIIHHNSDLLTGLVNDVLVLSELQSGKAKANIAPCQCNALCRSCIDTVVHRKPDGVSLDFTTDVADDFTLTTDARRLNQVIINFLTNAEKYTTEGSIVLDCSTKKMPGYAMFSVTDTGCGIPAEKQDQIFGRFEKLDDFHQGMGLGLNICTLIAQLLDAKIGIDKEYTNGSRFYFALKS